MNTEQIENIARLCHEVNKKWCEINDDFSQKSWEDAEEWQRESAITGVKFRLGNPEAKDSAQHDKWMEDKLEQGWVYGEEKDSEKKTHPCLVPFEELPEFQQKKDKLFCLVVDVLKEEQLDWETNLTQEQILKRWDDLSFLPESFFEDDKENAEVNKLLIANKYEEMAKTLIFLFDFIEAEKKFAFQTIAFPIIARLRNSNTEFWNEVDGLTKEYRQYYVEDNGDKVFDPVRTGYGSFDLIQFFTKYNKKLWKAIEIVEILNNKGSIDKEAEFCVILCSLFALYMNGSMNVEERINQVWQLPFSLF